jgi:hypothetical protein
MQILQQQIILQLVEMVLLLMDNAADAKIKINGQVYTLVYVDATEGWKTVGQTFNQITTADFVAATGGTITNLWRF